MAGVNKQRVPTAPGRSEWQGLTKRPMRGRGALARPNKGPQPEDYNRPWKIGLSESLHCADFADRLRVLLALLALCKAITPAPPLERGTHAIYSVKGVWVRDLGSITAGYVIGRLRTRVLLALRASGNASEGARPSPAGAAGLCALTAKQESLFGSFGGHCTIAWD